MPTLFYVLLIASIQYCGVTVFLYYQTPKDDQPERSFEPGCLLIVLSPIIGLIGIFTVGILFFTEDLLLWWLVIPGVILIPIIVVIIDLWRSVPNPVPDWVDEL